jgi:hypothetical protein
MDKMNKMAQKNEKKTQYTKPQLKKLGRLSTLIQGMSGTIRDNFPARGTHK